MNPQPLISIICLCYNHARFIEKTLHSVKTQSYKNIELIVVDDKSTDSSVQRIQNWLPLNSELQVHLIINPVNLGNTKSFNKALKSSKGKFIVDLAGDDILNPNFIKHQLQGFYSSSYPNVGVVFCNVERIDEDDHHISFHFDISKDQKTKDTPPDGMIYNRLLHSYFINPASMMSKREVFEALDGYDERLAYEDFDFWIRSSRTFNYHFVDEVLVQKRTVRNSLGHQFEGKKRRNKMMRHSTLQVCKKAYHLNKTQKEDAALLFRLTNILRAAKRNFDVVLAIQTMVLYLKTFWRKSLKTYNSTVLL